MDWHPWGAEAFDKARREDKPIFLSIGYSTCHWCHVMEEESFSNPAIAQAINDRFVPVKVDREERPDLDKIYMSYVIASTGAGGWPMTVFLTPDGKPFFGGTYFPPENRYGRPGITNVVEYVSDAWKKERAKILEAGEDIVAYLSAKPENTSGRVMDPALLFAAQEQFASGFDAERGGFGRAPKFPSSHVLSFLIRRPEPHALAMAETTLWKMADGGVYDHLGGGFHRYSVDAAWRVPHFEKMLYDQAMLLKSYAEAFARTRHASHARVARETAEYLLREMRSPEGAFYSAEDADSPDPQNPTHKREGAFYVWTQAEIRSVLKGGAAPVFEFHYGVEAGGNAPEDPQGEFEGRNILYQAHSLEETAAKFGKESGRIEELLAAAKALLFEARSKRPRPYLDDKILADWNGLAIAALSIASDALGEPRYSEAAAQAARFVLGRMAAGGGRLYHRFRESEAAIEGQLDDYAFLAYGLLNLYEATLDGEWLAAARRLADRMIELFWDEPNGGFYMTAADSKELLIARPKESYDGAVPSGNSIAALVLILLSRMTGEARYEERARLTIEAFTDPITSNPTSYAQMLIAFDFLLGPSHEIIVAGPAGDAQAAAFVREIKTHFFPRGVLVRRTEDAKPAALICRNHVCKLPIHDLQKLKQELNALQK